MPARLSRSEVEAFFSRLQAADPEPRTELDYSSPYTLLVAVVLSAQST
ncbi:MAG: endonuclease III, partial [Alphaproteobacteria bacterium]|nr:endonuclease III [Alphaproteobacteria bacterium]